MHELLLLVSFMVEAVEAGPPPLSSEGSQFLTEGFSQAEQPIGGSCPLNEIGV